MPLVLFQSFLLFEFEFPLLSQLFLLLALDPSDLLLLFKLQLQRFLRL